MKEESKEIIVIEEGIDEATPEVRQCCWGPMFFWRG